MALPPSHLLFVVLAPVMSMFSISMNVVTCVIFWKKFKLDSLSFILIFNICICDLLVCAFANTIYMANILDSTYNWSLGDGVCKLFKFFMMLYNAGQIMSLTCITVDRYRRLVTAHKLQWTTRNAMYALIGIWVFSSLICMPNIAIYKEEIMTFTPNNSNQTIIRQKICKSTDTAKLPMIIVNFSFCYAIPLLIIIYCLQSVRRFMQKVSTSQVSSLASRSRMSRQITMAFGLTTALFLLVWSPFFLISVLNVKFKIVEVMQKKNINFSLRCILLIIGSFKPVIYYVSMDRFRQFVKRIFKKRELGEGMVHVSVVTRSCVQEQKMITESES